MRKTRRGIEFRLWDGHKMVYRENDNGDVDERYCAPLIMLHQIIEELNTGKKALLQYTGLKDNTKWEQLTPIEQKVWLDSGQSKETWTGKKIYEGDIISNGSINREVKYSAPVYEPFREVMEGRDDFTILGGLYSFKIIGNVYENPELIKQEKGG